jgi:excinuclease ABC subunit A
MVREKPAAYLRVRACPDCDGTRLRRSRRHVFIGRPQPAEITSRSVEGASTTSTAEAAGPARRDRRQDPQGDPRPAAIPGGRGPQLPDARPQRRDPVRRRSAAHPAGQPDRRRTGGRHVHPRRALHRPAPARQRAPAAHADHLRDLGNTVLVVEHDEEAIRTADFIIDIGARAPACTAARWSPRGSARGHHQRPPGRSPASTCRAAGTIAVPKRARRARKRLRWWRRARQQPQGRRRGDPLRLCSPASPASPAPASRRSSTTPCTGHGHGIEQGHHAPARRCDARSRASSTRQGGRHRPEPDRPHAALQSGHLHRPVHADPRAVRRTQEARTRGYQPGRFSFNVKGGRCEACQGDGVIKVEMHFLPDIYVPCDVCKGKRYNRETLDVRYKGKNIHEVLEMTVEEARRVLRRGAHDRPQAADPDGRRPVLHPLGQSATTLSGGEAQRVKLAGSCRSATPAGRSTSSTSPPPACTSTTSRSCWRCCTGCATTAIPSWSSSTTSTSSRPPTGSSTWGRRAASGGGTCRRDRHARACRARLLPRKSGGPWAIRGSSRRSAVAWSPPSAASEPYTARAKSGGESRLSSPASISDVARR